MLSIHACFADLKPENLLFRTPANGADIVIIDFGLSRIVEGEKPYQFTDICGTLGVRTVLFFFVLRGFWF